MNQIWIVAYLYEINLYSYFQIGIIRINMRKGISNESQATFVCISMSFREKRTERERSGKSERHQELSVTHGIPSSDSP